MTNQSHNPKASILATVVQTIIVIKSKSSLLFSNFPFKLSKKMLVIDLCIEPIYAFFIR